MTATAEHAQPDRTNPIQREAAALRCAGCGVVLLRDEGDGLCQTCFVVRGLVAMVDVMSNRTQQSLIDRLLTLSRQAHQRGQTDAAYHTLAAAYHAAYEPLHLEMVIREAQQRLDTWEAMLDECGEVRADDYQQLVEEAQDMKNNVIPQDWSNQA
jgi:hypothetical protein